MLELEDLLPEHLTKRIRFESYGLYHKGILQSYVIEEPKQYELATKEYLHNNCQLRVINTTCGIDVPITYTSLPKDTPIWIIEPDDDLDESD